MHQLANVDIQIPDEQLAVFSDLSQQDATVVRAEWPQLPLARRRKVCERILDLELDELHVDFARFWRLVLHDSDAVVREIAVRGLTGEPHEDLVGPFVQFVINDPAETVRAAAAAALGSYVLAGELDELDAALAMRAEEALLDVLHKESEPLDLRCRALESIAFSSEVGIRQLIEDAYYAEDEELRVSSLLAMGRSADIRWRGKVCAELHNPSPAMRAEAAYACGELEAVDGMRDLIELIDDEHEAVRLASIFALGRLGGPEASSVLEALAGAPESIESEAAGQALEEMQFFAQADSIPMLNELMEDLQWEDDVWDDLAATLKDPDLDDAWDDDFDSDFSDDDLSDDDDAEHGATSPSRP
jgi:HEAT repeat protein